MTERVENREKRDIGSLCLIHFLYEIQAQFSLTFLSNIGASGILVLAGPSNSWLASICGSVLSCWVLSDRRYARVPLFPRAGLCRSGSSREN